MSGKNEQGFRTIGDVAESLDLPPHVLRFWETRFEELEPLKRAGGRRYYRASDVELLKALRYLLYGQGYTIKGVQRILREQGARAVIESVQAGRVPSMTAADREVELRPSEARRMEPPVFTPPVESSKVTPEPEILGPLPASGAGLPAVIAHPLSHGERLGDDDLRRLRAALADLTECRRLLLLTRE